MADVFPFRGWRYDVGQVGDLSDVTAPPYDVIDAAQQDALYKRHPCNVIRLELNREEPGDAPDQKYARAATFLRRWRVEGVLLQEPEEAFYVYHQEYTWEGRTYTRKGFLGRVRLEPFGSGCIYPHEQTLSGPKADRLALLKACRMNLSPIFGLYPDPEGSVQRPLEDAVLKLTPLEAVDHLGVKHRLWPVRERGVLHAVHTALRDRPVFIADGHHRYETALNYREWLQSRGELAGPDAAANFVLMACVGMSDPGLTILPTHRLVNGVGDLCRADLERALGAHFELSPQGRGPEAAERTWEHIELDGSQGVFGFGTTSDGEWLLARVTDDSPMANLAPEHSQAWRELGVSLLHKLALEHLVSRVSQPGPMPFTYVHSLEEIRESQGRRGCQLACLVPPAQISHVQQIASQFEKMPPKSTYFYPKLQTGLVFHAVD